MKDIHISVPTFESFFPFDVCGNWVTSQGDWGTDYRFLIVVFVLLLLSRSAMASGKSFVAEIIATLS